YQEFLAQNQDSPALQSEVAATYFRLWQLHLVNGEPDVAQADLDKGLAVLDALRSRGADRTDLEPLAGGLFRLPHYVHRKSSAPSNPRSRRDALARCLTIWEDWGNKYPDVAGFQHDLAGFYYYLAGEEVRDRHMDGFLRSIGKAIEISRRLSERHPLNA